MNTNSSTPKSASDILRRQNAIRMLDTILASSSSPPSPLPPHPSLRQKQPSPPSSQDTLAAFTPHITDNGYQPDTDDIGSNDDNSDSHDDIFSEGDLSVLLIQQDLQRQHAARKLQSSQLRQRQLLMQQHQRIFQDNQQLHSVSDKNLSSPSSSHIPGNSHDNNHAEEEEEQEDDDEEDEDEDDDKSQATSGQPGPGEPKCEQQYDNASLAQYQGSDDDNVASATAQTNSDKKPKARGRPKGTTTETTPSKPSNSNNQTLDKPKRQYKKTILRQQAALLAAQIKDENKARNTEATRRVLSRTGVIKHLRTLKHRLDLAQYKVDRGLQEQPLHMVAELFEDSLEDAYYCDDECDDNPADSNLSGNPHPSATFSTPKTRRDSSRRSPIVQRTKLSVQPGLAQRNTKLGDRVDGISSWGALSVVDLEGSDSESESDQGFPETPTKPRGRFAIPRSSAESSSKMSQTIRSLSESLTTNQCLPATPTTAVISQSSLTLRENSGDSGSDHTDSDGTDVSDSVQEQPMTVTPLKQQIPMPVTLEALRRQQEIQLEEFQRLQRVQLQALQEQQQKALLHAQSQWSLHQKSAPHVASSPNQASTPTTKPSAVPLRRKVSQSVDKENQNPFQDSASDKEQRARQERVMSPAVPRQANASPTSKPSSAKPPLPQGLQQRKALQTPTRSMTSNRVPITSPHIASSIPARTVERVTQNTFATPQRRPTKSPSPAVQRRRTADLASDTDSPHRAKSASPFTPKQLEEREWQKERIRENQLREQELIRKQRELEHQQRQQARRKQLLLQLQFQHLQEQSRLQSSEPKSQKSRPEPSKQTEARTGDGPSRLLFPSVSSVNPANPVNSLVTPKKKKPLNPVQKAPSTENILASVRSQQGIRSSIIAASSALASAKTVLLGNKRVLSTTEDKENVGSPPFSPVSHGQRAGGNQSPIASRQLQEKTYKRQRPAVSSPSLVPPRLTTSSPISRTTVPVNTTPISARTMSKVSTLGHLSSAAAVTRPSPSSIPTSVTMVAQGGSAVNQASKEFLNCFDQWMSDLGSEDIQGDTPTSLPDSTSDSVVSPFIIDQSQQQRASFHDVFSSGGGLHGHDDGTGTEPDESEIDQLLYSDFGEDYAVYGGDGSQQANIGTPVSDSGQVDLTGDFMKADFYDWFPDSFREQAVSGGLLAASTPPTPSEQRLSLLSTDPILSSSPAELSQGLELELDFDATTALSWSQQQRALQSPQQQQHPSPMSLQHHNHQQQLSQDLSPHRDLSSSYSRGGTPQLDSSGSLLSSTFTEILPPVVDLPSTHHYIPMGLGGGAAAGEQVLITNEPEEEEEADHLGKTHSLEVHHPPVDLAFFLR
ncbi:hypothetical protein BGZ95_003096 [Linnemannia exigua]|uniref:Uncharacterized protein n=1 Tax=Linnemannia exigua TaxID=604196 RepID=A0AAD4DIA5_9FUNG|nr:hypothetical protein BGZ95_003096 [Linnemannia exigua]